MQEECIEDPFKEDIIQIMEKIKKRDKEYVMCNMHNKKIIEEKEKRGTAEFRVKILSWYVVATHVCNKHHMSLEC